MATAEQQEMVSSGVLMAGKKRGLVGGPPDGILRRGLMLVPFAFVRQLRFSLDG